MDRIRADFQRLDRYAAEEYRRLQNAHPETTCSIIAQKYLSGDESLIPSGLERIDIDFGTINERIRTVFFETLQNPEVRGSIFDASEALHRAGFKTRGLTCSRGIVKVQSFRYEVETVVMDYGWTLRVECVCLGGRVSKMVYEKPEVYAIEVRIPNVLDARLCGGSASLVFVRPTLVDIRPIILKVRACAETYGCTDFQTNIPLDWVSKLWLL